MTSVQEALTILRAHSPKPSIRRLAIEECLGRVLAEDVLSPISLPPFDNSAMDGYAVGGPSGHWEVIDTVPAGDSRDLGLGPCEAVRIFTGSRIPKRTYAVLTQEDANVSGSIVSGEVKSGQHVRREGEELTADDLVLTAGSVLTPPRLAALASVGIHRLNIHELSCGVITTGNEVIHPGQPLKPGQIYNSNAFAAQAILGLWRIDHEIVHVQDSPGHLCEVMQEMAMRHPILLTTGGVSVGDHDHVASAAEDCEFELQFHKVAVKPGKPIAFGVRDDGKVWLGLPGNPLSTWVGMLVFFAALVGRELDRKELLLDAPFEKVGDREEFIPARVDSNGVLHIQESVGSNANTGLIHAFALAHLPAEKCRIERGETIKGLILPWSTNQ